MLSSEDERHLPLDSPLPGFRNVHVAWPIGDGEHNGDWVASSESGFPADRGTYADEVLPTHHRNGVSIFIAVHRYNNRGTLARPKFRHDIVANHDAGVVGECTEGRFEADRRWARSHEL